MSVQAIASTAATLAERRWDTPYRWLASIVGLAWVAGVLGAPGRALQVLADAAAWASADGVARHLASADDWLAAHAGGDVGAVVSLLLLLSAIVASAADPRPGQTRAVPTALLSLALAQYSWRLQPAVVQIVATGFVAGVVIGRNVYARERDSLHGWQRAGWQLADVLLSIALVPLTIVGWLVGSEPRRESTPAVVEEPPPVVMPVPALPTGAIRGVS